MQVLVIKIDFKAAAKRHFAGAEVLLASQSHTASAGQLYGFTAECGLKALLVAHGLPTEPDGDIRKRPATGYREHMPKLSQAITNLTVFPDGRAATRYISMLTNLADFDDWLIDHRYWDEPVLPLASVPSWREAARQVNAMLDAATVDGVMT